jgi:hypothetical protein
MSCLATQELARGRYGRLEIKKWIFLTASLYFRLLYRGFVVIVGKLNRYKYSARFSLRAEKRRRACFMIEPMGTAAVCVTRHDVDSSLLHDGIHSRN